MSAPACSPCHSQALHKVLLASRAAIPNIHTLEPAGSVPLGDKTTRANMPCGCIGISPGFEDVLADPSPRWFDLGKRLPPRCALSMPSHVPRERRGPCWHSAQGRRPNHKGLLGQAESSPPLFLIPAGTICIKSDTNMLFFLVPTPALHPIFLTLTRGWLGHPEEQRGCWRGACKGQTTEGQSLTQTGTHSQPQSSAKRCCRGAELWRASGRAGGGGREKKTKCAWGQGCVCRGRGGSTQTAPLLD